MLIENRGTLPIHLDAGAKLDGTVTPVKEVDPRYPRHVEGWEMSRLGRVEVMVMGRAQPVSLTRARLDPKSKMTLATCMH